MAITTYPRSYPRLYILATSLLIFIVAISLQLDGPIKSISLNADRLFPGFDKVLHAMANTLLTLLVFFGLIYFSGVKKRSTLVISSIICIIGISVSLEMYQAFSPDRSFEVEDILANMSGAVLSLVIIFYKNLNRVTLLSLLFFPCAITFYLAFITYQEQHNYYEGLKYSRAKNYALSKDAYLKSIESGNQKPSVYNSLAWLNMEHLQEDTEESLRLSAFAVAKKPNNANYLDTHRWALVLNWQPEKGVSFLKKALEINPDIFCINYHIGVAYFDLNQLVDAIYYLKQQIEYNDNDLYATRSREYLKNIGMVINAQKSVTKRKST